MPDQDQPLHPLEYTRSLRDRVAGRTDIPRIGWTATACPSRQWAVLGVDEPTLVRCGGIKGHDGEHRFTISWTGPTRDAVAEMFAALDAPVATATADQLRRKLLECEEALRTTEARAEKAEAERDALAAEVDRLRGVVDRCPADDTPLLHDDDNPQLKWWCSECGLITDRPSLIMEAPDA